MQRGAILYGNILYRREARRVRNHKVGYWLDLGWSSKLSFLGVVGEFRSDQVVLKGHSELSS